MGSRDAGVVDAGRSEEEDISGASYRFGRRRSVDPAEARRCCEPRIDERYRLESKRSAVEFALRQLVLRPISRDEVLAMRATGVEFTND